MKKITAIGAFLVGALLILFIVMPFLQRLNELEHQQNAALSESTQSSESSSSLVPENYQPVGAERIIAAAQAVTPKNGEPIKVGLLQIMDHPSLDDIRYGIIDQLAHRGYINGVNIDIDYKNGNGDQNTMKSIADQFMADGDDILIGIATPAAQALQNASQGKTPVVFAGVSDPLGAKLVTSLEKPGANITGATFSNSDEGTLGIIGDITPHVRTIGVLYNTSEQNAAQEVANFKPLAAAAGYTVKEATITSTNDLAQVAEQLASEVDAIFVPQDNTIAGAMPTLISVTNAHKIPVYPVVDAMVEAGGLATVGLNQYLWGADSGTVVADILEGADPAGYAVKVSAAVNTFINTHEATVLGITIPEEILKEAIDLSPSK